MNAVDDSAAANLQVVYEKLQCGPWNTGASGKKGATITEPLDADNPCNNDNISRYTDKYLRNRRIGRTVADFPFNPSFLPPELHRIVKITGGASSVNPEAGDSGKLEQRIADIGEDDEEKADEKLEEDEEKAEADEAEEEDEFEELEDDDYNAEKYFDDGDGDDYGDDGNDEAAY